MLNKNFIAFPVLTTERLTLRQLVISDEQEIFTLRSDSEINKYLDRQLSNSIDDAGRFINAVNENIHKNESLYWAITFNGKNTLVGTICLFGFSEEDNKCEIGFELLKNFQGQGVMKEAAKKVIGYAFHTMQVQKIEAFVHKDNQHSIKLLEQLSFSKQGVADATNPDLVCFNLTS